jgi:hypothetical protein
MSGTISHINRLGAVSLAALTLAAVSAPREALAGGIGSGSIWGSAHAYRDDPLTITFKGKTYTVYTSVTIVLDPMAVNVFDLSFSLAYDPAAYAFNPSLSGPLGAFSVGGDAPPADGGVGTAPMELIPSTGFTPGAPLPGSTLTYDTSTPGLLSVDYNLASPITTTGDVNDFRLDFTVLHPSLGGLGTVTYSPLGPGTSFTQTAFACKTTDLTDMCGSSVPAVGISISVPEPTTWALMLIGFAGLGAALRARRRLSVAAA